MNLTLPKQNEDSMNRKTEHFKALAERDNSSTTADHVKTAGYNIIGIIFSFFRVR